MKVTKLGAELMKDWSKSNTAAIHKAPDKLADGKPTQRTMGNPDEIAKDTTAANTQKFAANI